MFNAVFEISDISADISAIYRISEPNDTIFAIENRSMEKSKKIGKNRRNIADISASDRYFSQYFGIE